ncbi:MAG: ABC transporter ATP-binding protein [Candidatus Makaraimicrobium thalassicum]|nr:MAG: ABC transporter ATP-binding protein [Candidatus Omnitrophota bacterium]
MQQQILTVKNLDYTYGTGGKCVEALKGLNLSVNRGEIFGFIGPNGAGKTTTIKLLLGILMPQKGELSISGKLPTEPETRRTVGYMPETADYYGYLTPRELLNMYGSIFGIARSQLRKRVRDLLELTGIEKNADRLMRTFSKGMMQKVSFAQALVNDPDLLILDEPTGGLDPVSRRKMREVIRDLHGKGKTVFFSSHELSEVELVSDRIGILDKGHLLATGSVKDLVGGREKGQSLESCFLKIIEERI